MVLLLFAVQVLVHLYATSALTSAALRAAERVASDPADEAGAVPAAEAEARHELGTFGAAHTAFDWVEVDGRQVVLSVRAQSPGFVPLPGSWRVIKRTVSVRTERFR